MTFKLFQMVKIKWDTNFQSARTQLERTVMAQIEKAAVQAIGNFKCPAHKEAGEVLLSGKSLDQLGFQVSGCCEELIAKIEAKLAKL